MRSLLNRLFRFTGSYGLAIVVLFFLFLLTFLGTIEQRRLGLYEVQQRYFNSLVVMHPLPGGISIPLPGVYLLLVLFSVNLIVGGIVRSSWRWKRAGLLIVHGGILFLLLGGLVTHHLALEGQMTLHEGETSSVIQSYNEWELAIVDTSDPQRNVEFVIPQKDFAGLSGESRRTFDAASLPFTLTAGGYARNAAIRPAGKDAAGAVDGFVIQSLPLEQENERNLPALRLTLAERAGGAEHEELLWGASLAPLEIPAAGKTWEFYLRHRRWQAPFSLTLTKFKHEYYPNTEIPRTYQSDVIVREPAGERPVLIRMNEPLRHQGYTFFQSSFSDNPQTHEVTSTFAVVKNPSDQWPLIACIIVGAGLLIHFGIGLIHYLRKEKEKGARA